MVATLIGTSVGSAEASTERNITPSPVLDARHMPWDQRLDLAKEALQESCSITELAEKHGVSRKFVYRQEQTAQGALEEAFAPTPAPEERVLFYLPVTKSWLRQLILGLVLICHSSIRGVVELLRDLFDASISEGPVANVLQGAVAAAREVNERQDLSGVRIGAHDEIFQNRRPVLVGADVHSTFCYLLSLEDHRDADTWGVRLLELKAKGFHPDATIADGGTGLRAGQALALPGVSCRGDVFHAEMDMGEPSPTCRTELSGRSRPASTSMGGWLGPSGTGGATTSPSSWLQHGRRRPARSGWPRMWRPSRTG